MQKNRRYLVQSCWTNRVMTDEALEYLKEARLGIARMKKKSRFFFRGRNFCSRSKFSLYFVLNQKYCSREVVCACFLWSGVTSDPSLPLTDLGTSLRKLPDISAFGRFMLKSLCITYDHLLSNGPLLNHPEASRMSLEHLRMLYLLRLGAIVSHRFVSFNQSWPTASKPHLWWSPGLPNEGMADKWYLVGALRERVCCSYSAVFKYSCGLWNHQIWAPNSFSKCSNQKSSSIFCQLNIIPRQASFKVEARTCWTKTSCQKIKQDRERLWLTHFFHSETFYGVNLNNFVHMIESPKFTG